MKLAETRAVIDDLDVRIAALVAERRALVTALAREKASLGVPFVDPAREAEIERKYARMLPDVAAVPALVRAILEACR